MDRLYTHTNTVTSLNPTTLSIALLISSSCARTTKLFRFFSPRIASDHSAVIIGKNGFEASTLCPFQQSPRDGCPRSLGLPHETSARHFNVYVKLFPYFFTSLQKRLRDFITGDSRFKNFDRNVVYADSTFSSSDGCSGNSSFSFSAG